MYRNEVYLYLNFFYYFDKAIKLQLRIFVLRMNIYM